MLFDCLLFVASELKQVFYLFYQAIEEEDDEMEDDEDTGEELEDETDEYESPSPDVESMEGEVKSCYDYGNTIMKM